MTNIDEVTTTDIENLMETAWIIDHHEAFALCLRAMGGDDTARAKCAAIIRHYRRWYAPSWGN